MAGIDKILLGGSTMLGVEDEEARKKIEQLENPEFSDTGNVTGIASFPDFLAKVKSKMDIFGFFRDFAAGMKFVLHTGQIVNNCVSDRADLPLAAKQGKILAEELAKLYSDLDFTLEDNILSYAVSDDCKIGFSSGVFPGTAYAYSEELPDSDIKYGTWEINKRTKNTITVKLFSPYKSTIWINAYVNTYGWRGWQQLTTNSDLINIINKQEHHYGLVNYNESYDLAVQAMDDYTKNLITSVTIPAKTMGILTVFFDNAVLTRENGSHWVTFNTGFYTTPGSDISLINKALSQELELRSENNKTAYFSSEILTYPIFNNETRDIVLNAYAYIHTSDTTDPIEGNVHYNYGIQFLGLNL